MSFKFVPGVSRVNAKSMELDKKIENIEKEEVEIKEVKEDEVVKVEEVNEVSENAELVEAVEIVESSEVKVEEHEERVVSDDLEFRLRNAQEAILELEKKLDLKEKAIDLLLDYSRVSKEELARAISENKKITEITGKVLVSI